MVCKSQGLSVSSEGAGRSKAPQGRFGGAGVLVQYGLEARGRSVKCLNGRLPSARGGPQVACASDQTRQP